MKKIAQPLLWIVLYAASTIAQAQQPPSPKKPAKIAAARYQTGDDAVLAESKRWQETGEAKPLLSDDGKVLFPYGQYMPVVTCATYRVCDIELEPGEEVVGKPKIGDPRFEILDASSGPESAPTTHVTIKPRIEGLETNMTIMTDRRVYHLMLKSSVKPAGDFVHRFGFYYPEDVVRSWGEETKARKARQQQREQKVVTEASTKVSLEQLDLDYTVTGDAGFKPARVWNDGLKTFIQLPAQVRSQEMPMLIVLDDKDTPIQVNYRMACAKDSAGDCDPTRGDIYVIDFLVRQAMLVLGSQDDLTKVQIKSNAKMAGRSKSWWPF